ncbi:MAG TPA: hypothetical protein VF316_20065 [Polyangiaceae bacterium]
MILASILNAAFAILSAIVLVRTGSQPVADLAWIFMIISSAALTASALMFTVARDEPKVPRATSAKIAIGVEGAAALAPPLFIALAMASVLLAPFLFFSPMMAASLRR